MSRCFSFTESRNWCYRSTFLKSGLRSTVTDLEDGTIMHCWVPNIRKESKPDLLLIHGLGANALWQWADVIPHVIAYYNIYVPDLVFFGDSVTNRPDRSESFQAQCVMRVMEANSVRRLSLVGLSYGGFVGYSMAAQFKEVVERVVLCSAGVCMEEKDLREGVFSISDLEEAARILVPQTPERLRELVYYTFFRPPPVGLLPACLLTDFIDAMCTEYAEEKRELIRDIPKGRKLSDLPKISQPTLIIWGEHDQVFRLELAYRLKRHLGDNAQLEVIKNAGHAFNVEKPKEYYKLLKSFLVDSQPPPSNLPAKQIKPTTILNI
ncbi:2-hydroxy-6-oxo-2,4-heptadienoate hydrolase-like [Juglans microcarpa x Juglans regia]|uniref:2-hydroxy-6-oxo-2,4-heptadienoate hydrolase-like n=1 Tax=Juglans microcarpa x Juglans regia TaxID=2249226 RepID=UPI001B7DC17C|nr:2-hydroxy-6-oxo-2,4-heptadienoate hydrolase-like [Juglans microcarpa x Juglans regia]